MVRVVNWLSISKTKYSPTKRISKKIGKRVNKGSFKSENLSKTYLGEYMNCERFILFQVSKYSFLDW